TRIQFEFISSPFPDVADHIQRPRGARAFRKPADLSNGGGSDVRGIASPFVTPPEDPAIPSPGCRLPFGFCRQALTSPCGIVGRILPCDISHGVVALSFRKSMFGPRRRSGMASGIHKSLVLSVGHFGLVNKEAG